MVILKNIIKYFWIVNLALLFFAAYFLAGLINFNLSKKFLVLPAPTGSVAYAGMPEGGFNYHPASTKIVERNVFGTIDMTLAEGGTAGAPAITRVNATLNGILYFGPGSSANRAMIISVDQNVIDAYKIGDALPGGANIEDIQERKVILDLGGGAKQELLLEEIAGPPKEEPDYVSPYALMSPEEAAKKLEERRKGLVPQGIQRVSETYYKIDRSAITQALGNINDIVTQARMVPNFVEDGSGRKPDGFRVLTVKPGGIFEKLGIRNGDIISKINGAPMDNVETAFQLLQQLRFEKRFEIEITRGSRPLPMSYEIVE